MTICIGLKGILFIKIINRADKYWAYTLTHSTYMRNSNLVYVPKMEYVHKVNIFGLKIMVKSGLKQDSKRIQNRSMGFFQVF